MTFDGVSPYSTDISRHLPAPKVRAVLVSPASSPVIEIRQDSDSRSDEDMLEYMTTHPDVAIKPMVVGLTEVDAERLKSFLTQGLALTARHRSPKLA